MYDKEAELTLQKRKYEKIARSYATGMSIPQICNAYKCTQSDVYRMIATFFSDNMPDIGNDGREVCNMLRYCETIGKYDYFLELMRSSTHMKFAQIVGIAYELMSWSYPDRRESELNKVLYDLMSYIGDRYRNDMDVTITVDNRWMFISISTQYNMTYPNIAIMLVVLLLKFGDKISDKTRDDIVSTLSIGRTRISLEFQRLTNLPKDHEYPLSIDPWAESNMECCMDNIALLKKHNCIASHINFTNMLTSYTRMDLHQSHVVLLAYLLQYDIYDFDHVVKFDLIKKTIVESAIAFKIFENIITDERKLTILRLLKV